MVSCFSISIDELRDSILNLFILVSTLCSKQVRNNTPIGQELIQGDSRTVLVKMLKLATHPITLKLLFLQINFECGFFNDRYYKYYRY